MNNILPVDIVSSDEIDEILGILGDENIKLVDSEKDLAKEKLIEEEASEEEKKEAEVKEEARKEGALAFFDAKYAPEKVSVYIVGKVSKEVCAGPHVKNTSEIGKFRIVKEEAVSAGVRRIKAVLE